MENLIKRARKGLKFAFLLGILGIAGEWVGYILQIELVNYKKNAINSYFNKNS